VDLVPPRLVFGVLFIYELAVLDAVVIHQREAIDIGLLGDGLGFGAARTLVSASALTSAAAMRSFDRVSLHFLDTAGIRLASRPGGRLRANVEVHRSVGAALHLLIVGIQAVAQALLECKTLSGEDVRRIAV
jgi:hypothetical protein